MRLRGRDGVGAVGSLAHHLHLLRRRKDHPETGTHQRVVVDEKHPDLYHGRSASTTKSPEASGPCTRTPLARVTRSCRPRRPVPEPGRAGRSWAPTAGGFRTHTCRPRFGAPTTRTWARVPRACLLMLVSASCTMRYASRPKGPGAAAAPSTRISKSTFAPERRVSSTKRGMSANVGCGTVEGRPC